MVACTRGCRGGRPGQTVPDCRVVRIRLFLSGGQCLRLRSLFHFRFRRCRSRHLFQRRRIFLLLRNQLLHPLLLEHSLLGQFPGGLLPSPASSGPESPRFSLSSFITTSCTPSFSSEKAMPFPPARHSARVRVKINSVTPFSLVTVMVSFRLLRGLDNVQPQTNPLFIQAAGAVTLVEPVKNFVQLLRRDGLSNVAHPDVGFPSLGLDGQANHGARSGEFDGVVQQIIAHLGDSVRVSPDNSGTVRELDVDIQPPGW